MSGERVDSFVGVGRQGLVDRLVEEFAAVSDGGGVRVVGPLRARRNLAFLLGDVGRVDAAIAEYAALVNDHTRVLGPHHPETLRVGNHLATLLSWREPGQ